MSAFIMRSPLNFCFVFGIAIFAPKKNKSMVKLKTVCGFGDSVMKGVVVDKENSSDDGVKYNISDKGFAARCCNRLGIEVNNFARFGSTVAHAMKFIQRYSENIKSADYVLFEYGGNDCNYNWKEISADPEAEHKPAVTIPEFVTYYSEAIDAVRNLGARPVLLSLPILDPQKFFDHLSKGLNADNILKWLNGSIFNLDRWHERYNMEIFRLGVVKSVPVIDITSVFLEKRNHFDYLCEDGIHPNDEGHALIESAIMVYLRKLNLMA